MEYQARTETSDFDRRQRVYVWRRHPDGRLESVRMTDHGLSSEVVNLLEGQRYDGAPFFEYSDAVYPEIDGILKALHDMYRRTHRLDEVQPTVDYEPLLQTMDNVIEVERARVDKMLDKLMERIR